MIAHYLKITWRSISKDKFYTTINIVGLSVAMAFAFLLIFWMKFEMSYETCYPNYKSIYKVLQKEERNTGDVYLSTIRPGISESLKKTFPQIQYSTITRSDDLPFRIMGKEGDGIMATLVTSNVDFLKMFSFKYVQGSPESIVENKGVIISEETAKKFFGKKSPIGETISFGESGVATFTISAVVKVPLNTHIKFDILNPWSNDNYNYGTHYIKIADEYTITPGFEEQIANFLSSTQETTNQLQLQPIRDIHLYSPKSVIDDSYGSLSQIYLFSGAVILILIISIINYINTSIARSISRIKEVGVRKVFGANRTDMIIRFLFESFTLSLISVFISLVLVELLFPKFSEVMGNRIPLNFDLSILSISLLMAIIVAVLSGSYAAFYLSSLKPTLIIKGGVKTGSKENIRKTLIGIQFFLSITVLICTVIMYKQMKAVFTADTGINKNNIIIIDTSLWYQSEDFIQIIKRENANIVDATIASSAPYNSSYSYSGVSWTGMEKEIGNIEFTQIFCDHNYANTFGLEVIQGEFIPPELEWWQFANEESFHIVINESFKEIIGKEDPLGTIVTYGWGFQGKIIGVVKDFNFRPLKEPITPLIISFNPEATSNLYIKTSGKDRKATLNYILAKYEELKPSSTGRPAIYSTVEEEYNKMYENELRTAGMLLFFSIASLFLGLIGIISMLSFMIEKRSKEIAIRRINGAKTIDVLRLFYRDFLQIATIASVISIPISYAFMHRWLQTYIYKTILSWWVFAGIPLLIMIIVLIMISIQVLFLAHKNPVKALRNQ